MSIYLQTLPETAIESLGLQPAGNLHYQLMPSELVEDCLKRNEGDIAESGALVIHTGKFTGRSPKDRFIVEDDLTRDTVDWNEINLPFSSTHFEELFAEVRHYMNELSDLWIRDGFAGADPAFRLSIRFFNELPSSNLFEYNMFIRPSEEELENFEPEWQVLSVPGLKLKPGKYGSRGENTVVVSFTHKLVLVVGTGYTGEIKKSIFSVLNFLLPLKKSVLSMHCSANQGPDGDTAIFFGLSGTGKTTLSTTEGRNLIGDDEHGWSEKGIFNFEGGCYAKCINLSEEKEPAIWSAIRPGALLENVAFYQDSRKVNFEDGSITENTRVSYPLSFIPGAVQPAFGAVPGNIFFLTCDAFGILPPISKLTVPQAMYQFISGYTAKVAGTETGITEPKPTFSACFGAPFLPLHPGKYAAMLGEKLRAGNVKVWWVNTGWTGGVYGTGTRIPLAYTRALIDAALAGALDKQQMITDPVFGVQVPVTCPGVPAAILQPRNTWSDAAAYDVQSKKLASLFVQNFDQYAVGVKQEILAAAPQF